MASYREIRAMAREVDRQKFWHSVQQGDAEALRELRERQRMEELHAVQD